MQLKPKETLFGHPILKVREVVRQAMRGRLWGSSEKELHEKVAKALKQSLVSAQELAKQLVDDGYLLFEKKIFGEDDVQFELNETEKGRRFGVANAGKPISRQKATQLLNELIERAKAINHRKELAYYVESIRVFGSYLSDKEALGDLDIGVKLARKNNFTELEDNRIELARQSGRQFSNYSEVLDWPHREVMMLLKARKRGLSLHDIDEDKVFKVIETNLVFQYRKGKTTGKSFL